MKLLRILGLTLGLVPTTSFAYYTTMDTGEVLSPGHYRVSGATQIITDGDSGLNLIGRFDTGLTDEANLRAEVGFGTVDFHTAFFYKWVPIPDFENQPAIGLSTGFLFARNEGLNEMSLRLHPFVSKQFETEIGELTPYASLPLGLRTVDGSTNVPIQLVLGSELKTFRFENILFNGEIGLDIAKAFTYFSVGVIFLVDDEKGFQFN